MRIAIDVSYIQTRRAGIGRYSCELIEAVLAADQANSYTLHGWSFSIDRKELRRFRRENVRFRTARIPGAVKRAYWNRLRTPPIERLIGDVDIFHSADPLMPPVRRAKTIATVHDLIYKRFPQYFERHVLAWDDDIRRSLEGAAAVVVPSTSTKEDVAATFRVPEERIHVIYPPVSRLFHPTLPPNPGPEAGAADAAVRTSHGLAGPFILFVGTLEPRKNVAAVVKAFEIFASRPAAGSPRNFRLAIAGKRGWMHDPILAALDRSPARSLISYLDYLPEEELSSLYRSATMFVYPSFHEGYGSPVAEAMASGTPVIASKIPSIEEITGGAALLVDPHNVEEIAQEMERLAAEPSLRETLAGSGLSRAVRFNHRTAGEALVRLYTSVGGGGKK